MKPIERTLEEQRIEFANSSFLATPIAGLTHIAAIFQRLPANQQFAILCIPI